MLNSVPRDINKGSRAVTLRHPNSMPVVVYRKQLQRTAATSTAGIADFGGIGVLDSEDESEVDWLELGDAMQLATTPFQTSSVVNRGDALDHSYPEMFVLIEPLVKPDDPAYFTPKKHDVVYVMIGQDVKIAYEIEDVQGDVEIAPYTRKYMLNKRDDLTYIGGFPD